MMKKIAFAAALAATTAFAMPAYAATADSTVISGTVASTCSITGPADIATIDLTAGATTDLGNVTASCNSAGGFIASVSSDNSGKLIDTVHPNSGSTYAYQLSANGLGTHSLPYNFSTTSGVVFNNQALDVKLVMGAHSGQYFAGHYQDVLRWSITAQ